MHIPEFCDGEGTCQCVRWYKQPCVLVSSPRMLVTACIIPASKSTITVAGSSVSEAYCFMLEILLAARIEACLVDDCDLQQVADLPSQGSNIYPRTNMLLHKKVYIFS